MMKKHGEISKEKNFEFVVLMIVWKNVLRPLAVVSKIHKQVYIKLLKIYKYVLIQLNVREIIM